MNSPFTRRPHLLAAFTLVELLVVIGIIAVLISILLPALGRARQAANALMCMNNLRQIGMGFTFYEDAYEGYLPAGMTSYTTPGAPADWTALITLMLDAKKKSYDFAAMMRCPSNELANTARFAAEGYSYAVGTGLNGNLMRSDLGPRPLKISQVRRPSDKIMVFETNTPLSTVASVNFDFSGNKSCYAWHNKGANFLMCDGSVQSMQDPWLAWPTASRTVDGTRETKANWFRTTQSTANYNAGGYDRLWK